MPLSLLGCCNSLVVLFCCGGAKGGYGLPIHWGIGHDGLSAAESAVSNPDSGVVGRDAKALKKSGNFHEALGIRGCKFTDGWGGDEAKQKK
jgi:hypothetical protein